MKKVLSLVLVLALVLGMMPVFAAGETGAEMLYKYGFIAGNNGDLMVDKELTRAEMAVLVAEMNGLKDEAANYAAPANFGDVEAGKWYTPYVAYGQAQGWWSGYPDGTFKPEAGMSGQEFAAVLMNALKYDYTWNTVVADSAAIGVNVATTGFNRGAAFEAMWAAVNKPVKGEEVALGVKLGRLESAMTTEGPLAVDTVMANTAKSFEVKFKNAVADTSKVTFAVTRETTKVALTAAWNEAKTVATLTAAAKLPEGNYEVVVTGDAVALGTFKVTIEKEKVASVEFDTDVIVRFSATKGTVGYIVKNQYGENITDTALGRGITWVTSTDTATTVEAKTGIATITHVGAVGSELKDLKAVVQTVRDTTTGFVYTKTFTVSDTVAAVSEIKINGIVNEKGESVDFVYGTAKTYYLDYSALDSNGKDIKNYTVLSSVISGTKILDVTSSNTSLVTITPERHPQRNTEMAYRLSFVSAPSYDTPVTFIAVAPFTGKNSTVAVTLKRAARVEKFTLQAPAETVSLNKSVEFPFEAFDQNGNAVTSYDDITAVVTFTTPAGATMSFVRQADGSAKLFGTFGTTGLNYITGNVTGSLTGSFTQVSVDVKAAAVPTSITALQHSKAYTTGGSWTGRRINSLKVYDQFDREMNLRTDAANKEYSLKVSTSNAAIVSVNGGASATVNGDTTYSFTGGATFGTATITYELYAPGVDGLFGGGDDVLVDTASAIAYNIDPADITGAVVADIDGLEIFMLQKDARYFTAGAPGAKTAFADNGDLAAWADLFGKTNTGLEVRIPSSMKAGYTVSNPKFTADSANDVIYADGDFGSVDSEAATVTGLVYGKKGLITAKANITAKAAKPVANGIGLETTSADLRNGVYSVTNNVIEMTAANFNTVFNGNSLWSINNSTHAAVASPASLYFTGNSQYGDDTVEIDQVSVTKVSSLLAGGTFSVHANTGVVTNAGVAAGDEFSVSLTADGVTATYIFKIQ